MNSVTPQEPIEDTGKTEVIEQAFEGTFYELYEHVIMPYIIAHADNTDSLSLQPDFTDSELFLVVRDGIEVTDEDGKYMGTGFEREGLVRISQVATIPPRTEFVWRAYTEACKQLANNVASEIVKRGYSPAMQTNSSAKQADAGKSETIDNTRIPAGKYDELAIKWATRLDIPRQNKSEFLNEHASELTTKTFDRILADVHKREVIGKGAGKHGRYKPKTVP